MREGEGRGKGKSTSQRGHFKLIKEMKERRGGEGFKPLIERQKQLPVSLECCKNGEMLGKSDSSLQLTLVGLNKNFLQ